PMNATEILSLAPLIFPVNSDVVSAVAAAASTSRLGIALFVSILLSSIMPLPVLFPNSYDRVTSGIGGLVLRLLKPPLESGARVGSELGFDGQFGFELFAEFGI